MYKQLGQALASRPDLVSEGTMAELAALQDALPFYPNAVARELIRKELGAYPERVFDWMSTDPVAAASLGQVLTAITILVAEANLLDSLCHVLSAENLLTVYDSNFLVVFRRVCFVLVLLLQSITNSAYWCCGTVHTLQSLVCCMY
jgi:ABC1 atypical kinase-like domain